MDQPLVTILTSDGVATARLIHNQGPHALVEVETPVPGIRRGDRLVVPIQRVDTAEEVSP
jgi:hypothetical protein